MKINFSDLAYTKLKNLLLSKKDEYSCVRLYYEKTCCKMPPIQIYLDKLNNKEAYFTQTIKDIVFIYDETVEKNISSIELIFHNSNFLIKTNPKESNKSNCDNCTGCHSSNHSCNK